jgi:hypothetical protein
LADLQLAALENALNDGAVPAHGHQRQLLVAIERLDEALSELPKTSWSRRAPNHNFAPQRDFREVRTEQVRRSREDIGRSRQGPREAHTLTASLDR